MEATIKSNLLNQIRAALSANFIPEPFKQAAKEAANANERVYISFAKLQKRVGKEKANMLMNQFQNEASAGPGVNHEYMIRKMDEYKAD